MTPSYLVVCALIFIQGNLICQIPDTIYSIPEGTTSIDTTKYNSSDSIKTISYYSSEKITKQIFYPKAGGVDVHGFDGYGQFTYWLRWYPSGQIEANYRMQQGRFYSGNSWYASGALRQSAITSNDTCLLTGYYESGSVKRLEHNYRGNPIHVQYFCENGRMVCEEFLGKIYLYKLFSCEGKLLVEGTKNASGHFIGKYREWNENGTLVIRGQFVSDSSRYDLSGVLGGGGQKEGKWKYYNDKGKLEKVEIWKDGKLNSCKTFER